MFVYMSQPNLSALFAYICTIFYFFVTLFSIACMLSHGVVSIFFVYCIRILMFTLAFVDPNKRYKFLYVVFATDIH